MDRNQLVALDSTVVPVLSGVPQGAVLGRSLVVLSVHK